ncbi:DNA-binding transcriptional regulator, XRE-family HTH domain [Clostridium acidisoli DSM 12555]|uniref:DNA-binding transcriptional regulator, XRE-family HTH domain n=1 Tax=Clostridium acidisoli DSM 12555 TaxID=1121291 RepID=A0A1W1XGW2_9CLOT|nr:helix-turn-helix transcriptional regulator [Clostridium acidisoli]SMC23246.1 DNA-binding transcriptional regulator, XRE-family HTH domain [Clostridium acidisoli DSM 12555]
MYIINLSEYKWNTKLKFLRVIKGWSQLEASKRCIVNAKLYSNWENNLHFPQPKSQKLIARAFNISVEELFSNVTINPCEGCVYSGKTHKKG